MQHQGVICNPSTAFASSFLLFSSGAYGLMRSTACGEKSDGFLMESGIVVSSSIVIVFFVHNVKKEIYQRNFSEAWSYSVTTSVIVVGATIIAIELVQKAIESIFPILAVVFVSLSAAKKVYSEIKFAEQRSASNLLEQRNRQVFLDLPVK